MEWLPILGFAFGIIGFAGGAVGYFAKGRGDSIISYQATELKLRDETIVRQKTEIASLTTERDSLKNENVRLVGLAQGSPQLIKLTNEISRLVKEWRKDREDRKK